MKHQEWLEKYSAIKARAERVEAMRWSRFRALMHLAHVENPMMLHNAVASAAWGKPWPDVNYKAANVANYLDKSGWLWMPSRIVRRWDARVRGYNPPDYVTETQSFHVDRQIIDLLA